MKRNRATVAKVAVLAKQAGTAGEQQAAKAALVRLDRSVANTGLTEAAIKRLPVPATGNKVYFDTKPAGFGCRVTASGHRSYILNYRVKGTGQQRRVTIGATDTWSVGAARDEAKRLRRIVDNGGDPRGDFQDEREAPTMAALADRFVREYLPRKRPLTQRAYLGLLTNHIRPHFGLHAKVADIAYADVDKLHRYVTRNGSGYAANRCIAVLSKMLSLSIRWGWRTDNPARGIERNPEQQRKRYVMGDELARLTTALAAHPDKQFADIIRLLMLTGARRGEVMSMRWVELDLQRGIWSKPAAAVKQGRDHIVPLSAPAVTLLKSIKQHSEFIFPATSASGHVTEIKHSWAALCKQAGITGLRVHDLRHSFASALVSSGASLPLIGSLLGHASPTTTSRYSHLYDDPQRAAVERVGAIVGGGDRHG